MIIHMSRIHTKYNLCIVFKNLHWLFKFFYAFDHSIVKLIINWWPLITSSFWIWSYKLPSLNKITISFFYLLMIINLWLNSPSFFNIKTFIFFKCLLQWLFKWFPCYLQLWIFLSLNYYFIFLFLFLFL